MSVKIANLEGGADSGKVKLLSRTIPRPSKIMKWLDEGYDVLIFSIQDPSMGCHTGILTSENLRSIPDGTTTVPIYLSDGQNYSTYFTLDLENNKTTKVVHNAAYSMNPSIFGIQSLKKDGAKVVLSKGSEYMLDGVENGRCICLDIRGEQALMISCGLARSSVTTAEMDPALFGALSDAVGNAVLQDQSAQVYGLSGQWTSDYDATVRQVMVDAAAQDESGYCATNYRGYDNTPGGQYWAYYIDKDGNTRKLYDPYNRFPVAAACPTFHLDLTEVKVIGNIISIL